MRIFEGAQDDGGRQANGKDPPRPTVVFSLHSSPESIRRASDDPIHHGEKRFSKRPSAAPSMTSLKSHDTFQAWSRETRQFVSITAMHGVKRVWESRGKSKIFWGCAVCFMASLMTWQIVVLVQNYFESPFVSQVTLTYAESMNFPKITICNINPIKRSYLNRINGSQDFPPQLVQYLLLANSDPNEIQKSNVTLLEEDQTALELFQSNHPDFRPETFNEQSGYKCSELFKRCSFAGVTFPCCERGKFTKVMTSHGLCYYLTLRDDLTGLIRSQTEASETAGLQVILDAHRNESISGVTKTNALASPLDSGFRFYVDEPELSTFSTSQGVSSSPGDVVNTAISLATYNKFEDNAMFQNCTRQWPQGYTGNNTKMKYQSKDCQSKCKARFYNETCRCSPFIYNIDSEYRTCSSLEYHNCLDLTSTMDPPPCTECISECVRFIYSTSSSYGRGFSPAALQQLAAESDIHSAEYIRRNYLSISIFFRDLSYTEYAEIGASNIVSLLSNMGGTLGLFLGLSVLTVFECLIYTSKVVWMALCCSRKKYNARKERANKLERAETQRTVQSLRQVDIADIAELAKNIKTNSNSEPSLYSPSRENSWINLAEKEQPPFISINMPDH